MTEVRCPECEALKDSEDCYDCLIHADLRFYKSRIEPERKMIDYCRNGHRMTSDNIYERNRKDRGGRTSRCCILCKKDRDERRIRSQAGIIRKKR